MGARNTTFNRGYQTRDTVEVMGKCVGAAAANPTGLKSQGGIASIARTSSGKYTITLTDKWAALLEWNFNVVDSTAGNHYLFTVSSETVTTTKTIVVEVFKGATTVAPTRADLATTDTLRIKLVLANSQQVPNVI